MRIAFLTMYFPPRWLAGIELATYSLASELVKRGHEVHVFTSSEKKVYRQEQNGFTVHYLPYPSRIPLLSLLAFFFRVYFQVRKVRPDVLHIQSLLWGWMGAVIRAAHHVPYVTNGHGDDIYLDSRFKGPAIRFNLKHANAVIALTNDMRRKVEEVYHRSVMVVPNGVHLEMYQKEFPSARLELGLTDDEEVITFVGGLRKVKGVDNLVKALKIIKEERPRARLMIAGDGEERDMLESLAIQLDLKDDVRFVGKIQNGQVPVILGASDLLALPSLSEGLPLVVLEALAAGLPVVSSKVGGLPDVITDGENGFLTEPGNPQDLAEKVIALLNDTDLRKEMSMSNREKAKDYGWERITDRMEAIYQEIVLLPDKGRNADLSAIHTK